MIVPASDSSTTGPQTTDDVASGFVVCRLDGHRLRYPARLLAYRQIIC